MRRPGQVGLRQDQRGGHAARRGQRDDPLHPSLVGLGQRLDDEHELDVRGQHLAGYGRAGGAAHDRAAALEHCGDDAVAVERDPIAGRRCAGRGAQSPARGHELRCHVVVCGADEPASAMLGEHACAGVRLIAAELRELGVEIRSPADAGGWGKQGDVLHGFVSGTSTASMPGRCPGRLIRRPRRG